MSKGVIVVVVAIGLVAGAIALLFAGGQSDEERAALDTFAQCLTEKNTTMYGTFWCPKCAATKKRFGASFKYIHYVECDPRGDNEQSEFCLSKNIDKYDTWEFADGSRVVGEPSFETLGLKAGCTVPGAVNG